MRFHFHVWGRWEEDRHFTTPILRRVGGEVVGVMQQDMILMRRKCLFCPQLDYKEVESDRPVVLNWE